MGGDSILLPHLAFPPRPGNTVGGGDSPSYSGFFHCLAVSDDRSSSYFSPNSLLLCTGLKLPFHGPLVPCSSSSSCVTTCLPVHQLRNSLGPISCSCLSIYIPHAKHDQTPSLNKINYPYVLFIGSSFVYLLEHPSTPASGTLPTEQQYNGCFVNTSFILSTHHCLSLLIAFNTLFLSRLLCFSTLWTQYICNESI